MYNLKRNTYLIGKMNRSPRDRELQMIRNLILARKIRAKRISTLQFIRWRLSKRYIYQESPINTISVKILTCQPLVGVSQITRTLNIGTTMKAWKRIRSLTIAWMKLKTNRVAKTHLAPSLLGRTLVEILNT